MGGDFVRILQESFVIEAIAAACISEEYQKKVFPEKSEKFPFQF